MFLQVLWQGLEGQKIMAKLQKNFCPGGSVESFSLLKPMVHWWFWMVFGWFWMVFGWFANGIVLFNKTSAVWLMISTVQVGQAIFGLRSYMFMIINIQTYYCIYIYMNMICILYIIMYIYVYIIYSVTCMQYDCMYCIVYIVLVASILRGQDLQSQLWQSLSDWWGGIPWWVWFNATLNKWKGWMSCRFSL